jgi:SulP family sulfate permease
MAPLSVSLIVIVLGAAFGELLGIGAFIGMFSAFVAVALTSLIGGSPFGITSPTGPMTAVAGVVLLASGEISPDVYPLVLFLAALVLLACAAVGVTRLVQRIPNVVIVGFVNGIATLIALQQFRGMGNGPDTALFFATAACAVLLGRGLHTRDHVAWKILASTTSVVVFCSIAAAFMPFEFTYPLADNGGLTALQNAFGLPNFSVLTSSNWSRVLVLTLEVALIGLFDTLLTSLLMERQTGQAHQHRREVVGQAASLAAVSTIGGVPSAQSTVPSMMYFQEGARGRSSRIALVVIAGIILFVGTSLIPYVPDAVLSGIILKIAFDIADISSIRSIFTYPSQRDKILLLLCVFGTITATVIFSLNAAVIGFAVGFYVINRTIFKKNPVPDLSLDGFDRGVADEL